MLSLSYSRLAHLLPVILPPGQSFSAILLQSRTAPSSHTSERYSFSHSFGVLFTVKLPSGRTSSSQTATGRSSAINTAARYSFTQSYGHPVKLSLSYSRLAHLLRHTAARAELLNHTAVRHGSSESYFRTVQLLSDIRPPASVFKVCTRVSLETNALKFGSIFGDFAQYCGWRCLEG